MPDRSTADTAGTAETVGTAAASDITRQVDALLDRSTDGIVMDSRDRRAVVLSRQTVYQGAVFDVEDMRIALPAGGGDCVTVRRQVCRHAPCVVMLVHDEARDLYLLEREYRVGSDLFAYGLPAGLMDDGEDVEQANIDVPGFLLLCGNAFFQIPGRLVGHIIHLDSCFPYLVPESGNRTFIIGIIQNSGNRRR